jgi:hypothetical protein
MKKSLKTFLTLGIAAILLLSAGCKQYKIEVTMNEDGSGTRKVKLTAPTLGENNLEMTMEDFRLLFGLEEKKGWKMTREVKKTEEGEETEKYIFTLDSKAKRISSWRAMSGDIDVRGTLEKGTLSEVSFHNEIEVERIEGDVLVYRETLTWNKLKESLVDMSSAFLAKSLKEEYPFIADRDLLAIHHLLAGVVTMAWYAEELEDDRLTDEMALNAAADYIRYMIETNYPREDLSRLSETLNRIFNEEGEKFFDKAFRMNLPGAYLAGHTAIAFMVTMPGEIIETNAPHIEDNTAVWKYDLMLVAFNHPVELFVKAKIKK